MLAYRLNVRAARYIDQKHALDLSMDGGAWDTVDSAQRAFNRVIGMSSIEQLRSIVALSKQPEYATQVVWDTLFAYKRHDDLDAFSEPAPVTHPDQLALLPSSCIAVTN